MTHTLKTLMEEYQLPKEIVATAVNTLGWHEIEAIEQMLSALQSLLDSMQNPDKGQCATCTSTKLSPEDFTDNLSRREFTISRMCQVCQDKVFGNEEGY